jgi:aminopeptidase N
MASKPLKAWKPEWQMERDEVQSNQKAMALDSLKSTRPIRAKVSTPAEIGELFDAIAYEKGAAVLRMVESWVGEEAFRTGVNAYIERFQYGNAAAEDFWGTLAESTGKPVDRVMAGFVDQPGVPTVAPSLTCAGERGVAHLAQRAPAVPATAAPRADARRWSIPVCIKTPDGKTTCDVVADRPADVALDTCPAWVMANAGGRGYYRVLNPPAMLPKLAAALDTLQPAERMALLEDEWALVRAGRHDIGSFMELAAGFKNERNAGAVATLTSALNEIANHVATSSARPAFNAWMIGLLGPTLDQVGWAPADSEDDEKRALRGALVGALGETAADPQVIAKARALVLQELAAPGAAEPTLLNAAVKVAARHGDAALYEKYLARSRAASNPEEHYRYLYALADFSDPALVRRTVEYIVGPDVRSQDAKLFLAALLNNPDAHAQAWPLVRDAWPRIEKKTGQFGGNTVVIAALGSFCDATTAGEVARFFTTHKVPDAARTLQQALERIRQCSTVARAEAARLTAWLQTRGPAAPRVRFERPPSFREPHA